MENSGSQPVQDRWKNTEIDSGQDYLAPEIISICMPQEDNLIKI